MPDEMLRHQNAYLFYRTGKEQIIMNMSCDIHGTEYHEYSILRNPLKTGIITSLDPSPVPVPEHPLRP
jgi:hypothetical protein